MTPPQEQDGPTAEEVIAGLELELNAAGNRSLQQSIVIGRLLSQLKAASGEAPTTGET
jgi:hypothetical protein|tara:strand:+ start:2203 stop:2376 length:174 start_codon:yes stop_codon:yes gene_type:complete